MSMPLNPLRTTLTLCALLLPLSAQAVLVSLCSATTPCGAGGSVTAGTEAHIPVSWSGALTPLSRLGETVQSAGGQLQAVGAGSLLTTTLTLSQTLSSSPTGAAVAFTVSETLRIPAEASNNAAAAGATQLTYTRLFVTSDGSRQTASVQIPLRPAPAIPPVTPPTMPPPPPGAEPPTPPVTEPPPTVPGVEPPTTPPVIAPPMRSLSASGVVISHLGLRFSDGRSVARVGRDARLQANATLIYRQSGMLEAVWEIASPASTQGTPLFTAVQSVRQYLGAGREVVLQSPPLPTSTPGAYRVRLRILHPSQTFEAMVLSYAVSQQQEQADRPALSLQATMPEADAQLTEDTRFTWQPVSGARAYQLELYRADDAGTLPDTPAIKPVTGLLVPALQTEAVLSKLSLEHLSGDGTYVWRVLAIDADGLIIGASSLRTLHTGAP